MRYFILSGVGLLLLFRAPQIVAKVQEVATNDDRLAQGIFVFGVTMMVIGVLQALRGE